MQACFNEEACLDNVMDCAEEFEGEEMGPETIEKAGQCMSKNDLGADVFKCLKSHCAPGGAFTKFVNRVPRQRHADPGPCARPCIGEMEECFEDEECLDVMRHC
jgi:hypothetical protein